MMDTIEKQLANLHINRKSIIKEAFESRYVFNVTYK